MWWETIIYRALLSWGPKNPPFLPWLNHDVVNGMVVRGNTFSIIERIWREILDCL